MRSEAQRAGTIAPGPDRYESGLRDHRPTSRGLGRWPRCKADFARTAANVHREVRLGLTPRGGSRCRTGSKRQPWDDAIVYAAPSVYSGHSLSGRLALAL